MRTRIGITLLTAFAFLTSTPAADACTGIRLTAQDGAVVFGRTQEWETFDLQSRVAIIPRGLALQTTMPDGQPGIGCPSQYGSVDLDVLERDVLVDGMNERGLTVNLFYHEGFADYAPYDPSAASNSIPILALAPYLLTTHATVDEVRTTLGAIKLVGVFEESIGGFPPLHLMINDADGNSVVVEFRDGVTTIHDAPLGVITNGPNYD